MKRLFLIILFTIACQARINSMTDIINVCVESQNGNYCGTGWFISPTEVITAGHILALSVDSVVRIIDGNHVHKTKQYRHQWDLSSDVGIVHASLPLTKHFFELCHGIEVGKAVQVVRRYRYKTSVIDATVIAIKSSRIYLDRSLPEGWSGSPIIDRDGVCIAGHIVGMEEGVAMGYDSVSTELFMNNNPPQG